MLKAVLFDLDGTLLPMDQEVFVKYYFGGLCKKLVPLGFDANELVKNIWAGTKAMITNNGSQTNGDGVYLRTDWKFTTDTYFIDGIGEGGDEMTGKEIYEALQEYLKQVPLPEWAKAELQEAVDMGITDGSGPMTLIPRYQAAIMAKRAMKKE